MIPQHYPITLLNYKSVEYIKKSKPVLFFTVLSFLKLFPYRCVVKICEETKMKLLSQKCCLKMLSVITIS